MALLGVPLTSLLGAVLDSSLAGWSITSLGNNRYQIEFTSRIDHEMYQEAMKASVERSCVNPDNNNLVLELNAQWDDLDLEACQQQADKQLMIILRREFDALLQRIQPDLTLADFTELKLAIAAAITAADSHDKLKKLYASKQQIDTEITRDLALIMRVMHGKPLFSDTMLQPLNDHMDYLQSSWNCCCIFTDSRKNSEHEILSDLVMRLKTPLIGQTAKQLLDDARKKLGIEGSAYKTKAARLLEVMEDTWRAENEAKHDRMAAPSEATPLLPPGRYGAHN